MLRRLETSKVNTTSHPDNLPTPSLLLLLEYQQANNPVTRASLRKAIEDRISRGTFR